MESYQHLGFRQQQICEALDALGGKAELADIYRWLESHDRLTPEDLQETRYGGRPNFQHIIRSTVSRMVAAHLVVRVGRGEYRLVDDHH